MARAIGDFHLVQEGIKKTDGSGPLVATPEVHSKVRIDALKRQVSGEATFLPMLPAFGNFSLLSLLPLSWRFRSYTLVMIFIEPFPRVFRC